MAKSIKIRKIGIRAGLMTTHVVLALKDWWFTPVEAEILAINEAAAAGRYNETDLAAWFEANSSEAD